MPLDDPVMNRDVKNDDDDMTTFSRALAHDLHGARGHLI